MYGVQCTVYSVQCTVYCSGGEDIRTVPLMVRASGEQGEQGAKSSLTATNLLTAKTLLTSLYVGIGRIASVLGGK